MSYKVGIDFTYILEDEVSGIRKYGEEIIEGISKVNKDYEIVLFVNDNLYEIFKNKYSNYKVVPIKRWFKNVRYIKRINNVKIVKYIKKKKIEKEKCDIILYPYINKNVSIVDKQKKAIAILDLIPLDEIADKKSVEYEKLKKENVELMNKSEYIVTLSEYSKKRLMEINPNYKGEITVIPSSIEKLEKGNKKVVNIIKTENPYIFNINAFFRYKNQITLVKAFNEIKEKISHKLVLVGRPELNSGKSGYNEVLDYIEKNNLKDRVTILSYITDEDRNALFYNADLFVTTSLGEGFGRTPVEAALCKIPVISTKETALPEATMNEVFYYENAIDEKELANKILEVLNNKPSKEKLEEIAKN